MTGWQPQNDPRRPASQPPATPPLWGQDAPLRQYRPPQPQFQPGPQQQPYQQPQYAPQPPEQPRGSRKGWTFLGCAGLGALVVLIAVLASHSSTPSSSSPPPAAQQQPAAPAQANAAAAAQTVTYVVSGSPADVTYGPAGSDYSGSVPLHVTKPIGTPAYYVLDAQLQSAGAVSCKIEVDGKTVSSATASGGYNIAMCEIVQDPLSGQWEDANG
jgi:hypothetical protein